MTADEEPLLGPRPPAGSTDEETDLDELLPGEERFDYGDGLVAYQRRCLECDAGLLVAPARWCPACGGSGYRVRWLRPELADEG